MTDYKVDISRSNRVRQGDIYRDVTFYESYKELDGNFELLAYEFPYVIVLTQDCDLEQNKNNREKTVKNSEGFVELDKHLISVIVAPLYNAEHLFSGEHLDQIGIKAQRINSELKKPIKFNQNPRYHFIKFGDDIILPDSVIDFKHYFSVSLDSLESNPLSFVAVYQRFIVS